MGIFQNIHSRYTAMKIGLSIMSEGIGWKAPGKGNGILSWLGQQLQNRYGEPPKRSSKQWIELYGKSPRLRPVYKIAKDVAASEWNLYASKSKKNRQEVEEHPLIDLLMKPNQKMTNYTLFYLTQVYFGLRGECGWLIERNGLGIPSELWPVPPHWVLLTPSVDRPYYLVMTYYGKSLKIAEEDMIWLVDPDPANPYGRGLGAAEGIGDEVETDEYMAKWAKRFFFNDAKPPVIIEAPGMQEEQTKRLEEKWMEKYSGTNNAHKPAFMSWSGKVTEIGKGQKEMDFVESRKFLRDTANQHFLMPPEVMGIIENSNRATIDAADYLYTKNVLKPALTLFQELLNIHVCPLFDEKLYLEFENVVPEDKMYNLRVANDGLQRGAVMVNEWRVANGLEPTEGGDVFYIPVSMMVSKTPAELIGVKAGPSPPEPLPTPEPEPGKGIKKKSLTSEGKVEFHKKFDAAATKHEKKCKRAMGRFFRRQKADFLKKFDELTMKSIKADELPPPTPPLLDPNVVEELLNWTVEGVSLQQALGPAWEACMQEGYLLANETFDLGISFDLFRPEMLDHISQYGLDQAKNINDTTKMGLRTTIEEGVASGESIPEIRDRVMGVFDDASRNRATTIARTETHNTVSSGTFKTYKLAGVKRKEWLTSIDGRERPSHYEINGQVRNMDESFSNGLDYPGASGPAEEVVNCRCCLIPVMDEEE